MKDLFIDLLNKAKDDSSCPCGEKNCNIEKDNKEEKDMADSQGIGPISLQATLGPIQSNTQTGVAFTQWALPNQFNTLPSTLPPKPPLREVFVTIHFKNGRTEFLELKAPKGSSVHEVSISSFISFYNVDENGFSIRDIHNVVHYNISEILKIEIEDVTDKDIKKSSEPTVQEEDDE